ncbi:hypothetical protein C8R47DRAFT_1067299 [Mycena vitilis]|nr:hypothetical protein C8R47DRAFT_1067299 [Mycena vitilis]
MNVVGVNHDAYIAFQSPPHRRLLALGSSSATGYQACPVPVFAGSESLWAENPDVTRTRSRGDGAYSDSHGTNDLDKPTHKNSPSTTGRKVVKRSSASKCVP